MAKSASFSEKIHQLKEEHLLPLICAAAILRDEDKLRKLILTSANKGIKNVELYESLLQNYLFAGYPSAMISLKLLSDCIPDLNDNFNEKPDLITWKERGTKNCKRIYGRKFDKLIKNVNSFSPELSEWLLLEGYGKVMGRRGLSLRKRELNNVSILTVLKFEDQLFSHINGALRTGSTFYQVQSVINNLKLFECYEEIKFGRKVFNKVMKQKGIG